MTLDIYKYKDPLSYAQISLDELKNGSQGIWLDPPGKPVTRLRNPLSSAGLILGASGSAMFNSVFCHPGTKLIDIESEPHWIHAHMCLFGSLGLKYGIFEATPSNLDFSIAHKPYNVNIVALMKRISQFDRS